MGYMGFGMQKWIYWRNPKKSLFERKEIPSFTSLQSYSRTFSIQPSLPLNRKVEGILSIVIAFVFLILGFFSLFSFSKYSKVHTQRINALRDYENKQAFKFLLVSGQERLMMNRIHGAYSEFKLAYKIFPGNKELNDYLRETLFILCERNPKYCSELNDFLQKSL